VAIGCVKNPNTTKYLQIQLLDKADKQQGSQFSLDSSVFTW